jgi:hypothetical protein
MLKCCEAICTAYTRKEFGAVRPFDRPYDLLATEGGTAAMTYVSQTLKENKLLSMGAAYQVVLLVLSWVRARSLQMEAMKTGGQIQMLFIVLKELAQPFRW